METIVIPTPYARTQKDPMSVAASEVLRVTEGTALVCVCGITIKNDLR